MEITEEVLSKGDPMQMEGAIVKLSKEGKVDEPFLLLPEANADQARAAGAMRKRAMVEKERESCWRRHSRHHFLPLQPIQLCLISSSAVAAVDFLFYGFFTTSSPDAFDAALVISC